MKQSDVNPQRKSIRLKGYDYSMSGCYFVTIVTKNRYDLFGCVVDGQMKLNDAGLMVHKVFDNMFSVCQSAELINMVVMPNHLHCLISIMSDDSMGLSQMMRYLKSRTTVEYIHGVWEKGWPRFDGHLWQSRYYDHIVRNQHSYDKINEYIYLNPKRWNKDKLNLKCDADADDINMLIKNCGGGQIQEYVPTVD